MSELRITAGSTVEAACIARELEALGAAVEDEVSVRVSEEGSVSAVLTALDKCLGRNRISAVTVSVDGKRYVMEPSPSRLDVVVGDR